LITCCASNKGQPHTTPQPNRNTPHPQEKRKREKGQSTKAKNFVEEEKRLQRNFGMYSGFD